MKRFLPRIGGFFWSWRFLKIVLWVATIIVLFYAEEDWRGARAWAATKAKWEGRGESFDFNRLIPPPVPDADNLGALPLFRQEHDAKSNGMLMPLTLEHALRDDLPGNQPPSGWGGGPTSGEPPDVAKIRTGVAANYQKAFKGPMATSDPLAQVEALYPFIADLREAAKTRRYCRFQQSYQFNDPYNFSLRIITDQIPVSKIMAMHALLALDEHRPQVALDDIHANLQIAAGMREQPLLVSGLVAMGVTALTLPPIRAGLMTHAWNDDQVAELEQELGRIDYFSEFQRCLDGEALNALSMIQNFREWRPRPGAEVADSYRQSLFPDVDALLVRLWPAGWSDELKSRAIEFDFTAAHFLDGPQRIVRPAPVDALANEVQRHGEIRSLWRLLADIAAGPIAASARNFAIAQANADEARIACALERYRLARGSYPTTLEALAPAFIDSLPHDVMDGAPYRYRVRSEGGYLLYSVGWNQKDDGGKVVYGNETWSRRTIDYTQGDWPWVMTEPVRGL